jgi:hypothetical protein
VAGIGLRKMALRKLRSKPPEPEGRRKPALFEPGDTLKLNACRKRVRRVQAYAVIFSHFSAALIFFVTFLHQGKKVNRVFDPFKQYHKVVKFIIWFPSLNKNSFRNK